MASQNAALFWKRRAALVACKHNLAEWLAGFLPIFLAAAIAGSCALLILRRQEMSARIVWWILAGGLVVGALIAALVRRKKFFSQPDALVRLEAVLRLHNGLTAALAGIGAWPSPVERTSDHLRWNWSRLGLPLLGGAALLYAASSIPLPGLVKPLAAPLEQPAAWTEVQSWIDTLQKADVVEPQNLENLREQLDSLRNQDAKDWYEHASLEAGDNLQAETQQSIRDLQQNLQTAADNAAKMLAAGDQPLTDSDLKAMTQALGGALQNLQTGKLGLNQNLLKKLQKMDPKALKSLSPQQLAQLQQQLQKGNGACQQCLAGKGAPMMTVQKGGTGSKGKSGGLGGGGGPADLTARDATNLHTKTADTISNEDLSRALPGEIVGLSESEHQVDKTKIIPPVSGGQVASPGEGGQTVWKDSLTPDERETLGKYFK